MVLLSCRLHRESEFVSCTMAEGATKNKKWWSWFTKDEIYRKYWNLIITYTYKRIKRRNTTSSEAPTSWKYFDMLDEVYGTSSNIYVAGEIVNQSMENLEDILRKDSFLEVSEQEPSKRCKCKILDFLKKGASQDRDMLLKVIRVGKR